MNKKIILESFLATILVFLVLWILFLSINISFKPFNYVVKSIKQINLNDLYFSKIENNSIDTNIIIINTENLKRKGISDVLNKVNDGNPAVIGLDIFFYVENNTPNDSLLLSTLHNLKDKLVMSNIYSDDGVINYDYWYFDEIKNGHSGILTNKNGTDVVREFEPKIYNNYGSVNSFSTEIVARFDADAANNLKQRNNKKETINYIGGTNAFRVINYKNLLRYSNTELGFLKNKIVMVGFCGGNTINTADLRDIYYTPVGFEIASNRPPDMYGIIIHANIVSMIIKESYINHSPNWIVYLITIILTFLYVTLFTYFYVVKHLYFHIAAKLIQLVTFILILWIVFLIFSNYQLTIPTKYLLVSVILSVDVLYLYEALAVMLYKKYKIKSIFVHDH
ncbi:MAG: hypothetical protein DRI86_08575 [Bacteroidetes bacterium]|nr:MAG: hypothetical protein DRI86_08575 [Bacteroidota bacterium]